MDLRRSPHLRRTTGSTAAHHLNMPWLERSPSHQCRTVRYVYGWGGLGEQKGQGEWEGEVHRSPHLRHTTGSTAAHHLNMPWPGRSPSHQCRTVRYMCGWGGLRERKGQGKWEGEVHRSLRPCHTTSRDYRINSCPSPKHAMAREKSFMTSCPCIKNAKLHVLLMCVY